MRIYVAYANGIIFAFAAEGFEEVVDSGYGHGGHREEEGKFQR